MTLAPSRELGLRLQLPPDDWCVTYTLEPFCYVPNCGQQPEPGSHHIEPRSRTAGPKMFVSIDGLMVPNTVKLCTFHHRAVTGGIGGHKARIVWVVLQHVEEFKDDWPNDVHERSSHVISGWVWQERADFASDSKARGGWITVGPLREVAWQ